VSLDQVHREVGFAHEMHPEASGFALNDDHVFAVQGNLVVGAEAPGLLSFDDHSVDPPMTVVGTSADGHVFLDERSPHSIAVPKNHVTLGGAAHRRRRAEVCGCEIRKCYDMGECGKSRDGRRR
jgi:hypothetical protein